MWMFVEGIHLYLKVNPSITRKMKLKICAPIAWGLPAIIVSVTLGMGITEYAIDDSNCWLPIEHGIVYAFIAPALAITVVNMIFLVIIIYKYLSLKTNKDKSDLARIKASVRAIVILIPLLGGTWIFGVLQFDQTSSIVFSYLFTICNGLQGVFIFFGQCLLDKDVLMFLRQRSSRVKVGDSFLSAATMTTHEGHK
ncbi:adhesion G-protein coupled receptor D1-like [Amphiura filiformis]|uniref:adhesion G-protein coupled receptor D1-like n=1 Tax=Amphiura filiformis TaxID=82378 RepID=UPI003B225969